MLLALPGGRGMISAAQEMLRTELSTPPKPHDRLRLTSATHDALQDFRWLARNLASQPMRFNEIIPAAPYYFGAADASGTGMGGIWLPTHAPTTTSPLLWRQRFPSHLSQCLVSFGNPTGTITNSDLELAAFVAQQAVLASNMDIANAPFTRSPTIVPPSLGPPGAPSP